MGVSRQRSVSRAAPLAFTLAFPTRKPRPCQCQVSVVSCASGLNRTLGKVMKIQIIATPPGEAPIEIRKAWVGLELPLIAGDVGPVRALTKGVLTGPKTVLLALIALLFGKTKVVTGFRVDAANAVGLLEQSAPDAARWWRTHAPHLFERGRLCFSVPRRAA